MAVKGIQFSEPMVRALLAGRKTQTRRIIDLDKASAPVMDFMKVGTDKNTGAGLWEMRDKHGASVTLPKGRHLVDYHFKAKIAVHDLLYVREGWHVSKRFDDYSPAKSHNGKPVLERRNMQILFPAGGSLSFGADNSEWNEEKTPYEVSKFPGWAGKFRQAMHMPRWASRITLEVTDVRIERLKSISEADACAEGIEMESADPPFYYVPGIWPHNLTAVGVEERGPHAARSYWKLWDVINGVGAADQNPWVIAYSFRLMRGNVDDLIENGTIEIGDPR